MQVQTEEIICYEVVSADGQYTTKLYNIEDVIKLIQTIKYSEVRKISRLIIE